MSDDVSPHPRKSNGAHPPAGESNRRKSADVFADMRKLREEAATPLIDTAEILVNVSVRKPKSSEFFRTNPDPEMSMAISIYDNRDDQTVYYVHGSAAKVMLAEQLRRAMLVTCINQSGAVFLWPIKMTTDAGGSRAWSTSAMRAAVQAQTKWVRVIGELKNQAYRVFVAKGELPEPVWPEHTLQEFMILGFEDTIIDSPDHPVVLGLQGLGNR